MSGYTQIEITGIKSCHFQKELRNTNHSVRLRKYKAIRKIPKLKKGW